MNYESSIMKGEEKREAFDRVMIDEPVAAGLMIGK
jgi:hypothetical protein